MCPFPHHCIVQHSFQINLFRPRAIWSITCEEPVTTGPVGVVPLWLAGIAFICLDPNPNSEPTHAQEIYKRLQQPAMVNVSTGYDKPVVPIGDGYQQQPIGTTTTFQLVAQGQVVAGPVYDYNNFWGVCDLLLEEATQ